MNTKEYQSKEGNVLVGKDMSDAVKATILDVNTVTFGKGTDDERTTLQLTVKANDGGFEGEKVLARGVPRGRRPRRRPCRLDRHPSS